MTGEATGAITFEYDANGNLKKKTQGSGIVEYEYDVRDQMRRATSGGSEIASFDYDYERRRLSKTVSGEGVSYVYDGDRVINEYATSGQLVNRYDYGADLLRGELGGEGERFYFSDVLGSITALGNGSGGLAASYEYEAWGGVIRSEQASLNEIGYTGQRLDNETGLMAFGNGERYYSAGLGQFIQQGIEGELGEPQSLNRHSYAMGNPLGFDVSGMVSGLGGAASVPDSPGLFVWSGLWKMALQRGRGLHPSALSGGVEGDAAVGTFIERLDSEQVNREGLKSFFEGLIVGDIDDLLPEERRNRSWSKMLGQVVGGIIPVWGQIADARDIGISLYRTIKGEPGAELELALSAVAIIPFFGDTLKTQARAGKKLIVELLKHSDEIVKRVGKEAGERIASSTSETAGRVERSAREAKESARAIVRGTDEALNEETIGAIYAGIAMVRAASRGGEAARGAGRAIDDVIDYTEKIVRRGASPRAASGGKRPSPWNILDDAEVARLRQEFQEIGGDPDILRFNQGPRTSYVDDSDLIYVRGDVLPIEGAVHPRARLSSRGVLAHELGHRAYKGTKLKPGAWNDEFRASYWAAKNARNLSEVERADLINDAILRAREAGISIRYNKFMRKILYGYE